MRRWTIILNLIFISTINTFGQTPTVNEINMHMDSILVLYKDRPMSIYIAQWDTTHFRSITQIDKICDNFENVDCDFFFEQIKNFKKNKWDKERFAKLGLRTAKKDEKGNVWGISIPLFTKDRQTFVIDFGYGCGNLCGESCTYIYKRENNKWKLWKKFNCWTS